MENASGKIEANAVETGRCYNCGRIGHISAMCTNSPRQCSKCGDIGHMREYCDLARQLLNFKAGQGTLCISENFRDNTDSINRKVDRPLDRSLDRTLVDRTHVRHSDRTLDRAFEKHGENTVQRNQNSTHNVNYQGKRPQHTVTARAVDYDQIDDDHYFENSDYYDYRDTGESDLNENVDNLEINLTQVATHSLNEVEINSLSKNLGDFKIDSACKKATCAYRRNNGYTHIPK